MAMWLKSRPYFLSLYSPCFSKMNSQRWCQVCWLEFQLKASIAPRACPGLNFQRYFPSTLWSPHRLTNLYHQIFTFPISNSFVTIPAPIWEQTWMWNQRQTYVAKPTDFKAIILPRESLTHHLAVTNCYYPSYPPQWK